MTNTDPKAYLNYLLYDNKDNLIGYNFHRVSAEACERGQSADQVNGIAHERLYFDNITITQPGYMYIYLSNENSTPVEVFFDDFKVTHTRSPVIQAEDYYPFGLMASSYRRENSLEQNYLYNGKELQTDLELDWYDYGARMYMSELGRFTTHDRYAYVYQSYSPYSYALNNPIRFEDTEGEGPGDRVQKAISFLGTSYSQEASLNQGAYLRTGYSNAAYRYLDCSELVYRVLAADGITDNIEHGHTGTLKSSLNNNEKFIKSQSPEVGDIFLWRSSTGHTGIVTGVETDEDGNILSVTVVSAFGVNEGTIIQTEPLSYFAEKTGWEGFFRPVDETEDGKLDKKGRSAKEVAGQITAAIESLERWAKKKVEKQEKRDERRKKREEKKKEEEN